MRIAIIDTGIDDTHPDLDDIDDDPGTNDPKVILEMDFTGEGTTDDTHPLGHGTHVAGIAAGTGFWSINNLPANSRFIGVAPEAFLLNMRVFNSTGWSQVSWIVQAIDWAVFNGADVINLSLGVTANDDGTSELSRAADDAVDEGVVVVAAANDYEDPSGDYPIGIPADAFNVITVGAIDDHETVDISDDTIPNWSGHGPTLDNRTKPDVVAPGVNIWSTGRWSQGIVYRSLNGTSMAAPHVSGIAALLLQANPNWTPNLVKDALKRTARLNTILQGLSENERGKGIIDAFRAVQASPDGTYGWDPYQVMSRDETTVIYDVTRVENVPTLRNIQLNGILIANMIATPYLWLADQEYKLNDSLLVSGPRVYNKGSTSTHLKLVYSVDGVKIHKFYPISQMGIQPTMAALGNFSWLGYYDLDLHGPDHNYATWANCSIIWNEAKLHNTAFYYNNTQYSQPWILFNPNWWDGDADNWILRYHGGFSNNPDNYKNNESIYDTNLVIYQKVVTQGWFWTGLDIRVTSKIHDVAVTNVTTVLPYEANATYPGWVVDIPVTVKNEGTEIETFDVTAYANTTIINTQNVTNLAPGQNTTLTFVWTVPTPPTWTPYPPHYTISAEADVVSGETDTSDNAFVDGSVTVKHPGDVDGDGDVDSYDYGLFVDAFGSYYGDPDYDWRCDFDGDVDVFDFATFAGNYGWQA